MSVFTKNIKFPDVQIVKGWFSDYYPVCCSAFVCFVTKLLVNDVECVSKFTVELNVSSVGLGSRHRNQISR